MAATIMVLESCLLEDGYFADYRERSKYDLVRMTNSTDFAESVSSIRPDVVVVDIDSIPKALELIESTKKEFPLLPLIALSSNENMQDVVTALRQGADDYLIKPLRNQELLEHAFFTVIQSKQLEKENRLYRSDLEKTNHELRVRLEQLKADQHAAHELQLRMLPDPFTAGSFKFDHRIQPSLLLSGDFFDYFELTNDMMVFYLADVSGHGASSAFATILLKNMAYRLRRNYLRGSSNDILYPANVLKRFNTELLESQIDKHLTMFFGVIDIRSMTMSYSIGGHYPLPILLVNDKARFIEGRGMPVGLFSEPEYQNYKMQLPERFSLMMLSDGILEIIKAPSLGEKEEKLLTMMQESDGDIAKLWNMAGIDQELEIPDDIALVTIRRE